MLYTDEYNFFSIIEIEKKKFLCYFHVSTCSIKKKNFVPYFKNVQQKKNLHTPLIKK